MTTTAELQAAVDQAAPEADLVIMAAAVADFRPKTVAPQKIKKQAGQAGLTIELVKNPDILAALGAKKRPGQVVVGFAAETTALLANAEKKLAAKGADYIVANDASQAGSGFGTATNRVTLLQPHREPQAWPLLTKEEVGRRLIATLAARLQAGEQQ